MILFEVVEHDSVAFVNDNDSFFLLWIELDASAVRHTIVPVLLCAVIEDLQLIVLFLVTTHQAVVLEYDKDFLVGILQEERRDGCVHTRLSLPCGNDEHLARVLLAVQISTHGCG